MMGSRSFTSEVLTELWVPEVNRYENVLGLWGELVRLPTEAGSGTRESPATVVMR